MKKILLTFMIMITGCSAISSAFDGTHLVYRFGSDINKAETPSGFTVSAQEISAIQPLTKFGWNVYADDSNYYLSPCVQKLLSKSGDNSYLARKNGIRIHGKDRVLYGKIMKAKGNKPVIGLDELQRIINKHDEQHHSHGFAGAGDCS